MKNWIKNGIQILKSKIFEELRDFFIPALNGTFPGRSNKTLPGKPTIVLLNLGWSDMVQIFEKVGY